MKNLYKLILDFEDSFNKEKIVLELKKSYLELSKDKNLVKQIKNYHETRSESLKTELINNPKIRNIKHLESNLNYLILEINQNLTEITGKKKGC